MKLTTALTLLYLPAFLFANGGPINWTELLQTGNIEFRSESEFELLEENIRFEIDGDHVVTTVDYYIENNGPARDVPYAFPIDIHSWDDEYRLEAVEEEIRDFALSVNGSQAEFELADSIDTLSYAYPDIWELDRQISVDAARVYFAGNLSFPADDVAHVRVSYRVKVQLLDLVFTKSPIPLYANRMLLYDLSPAANWGSGRAGRFSVTIDSGKLQALGGTLIDVPPGGRMVNNTTFVFEAENFDLGDAPALQFAYDYDSYLSTRFFTENRIPASRITGVSASSTLAPGRTWTYDASNLVDNDFSTAWVEGVAGNGAGQYIDIELDRVLVQYIGLVNGFTHSEEFYRNNARAERVTIELFLDTESSWNWAGAESMCDRSSSRTWAMVRSRC
jgi:hypothetical protein